MRLINAHTRKLKEVLDENVKRYAILSHRWENDEVSFQDMQNLATASTKKGFAKIRYSCRQAIKDGYNYIWVDTCCINKDSSAELSEAINSMYRWYKASAVCYAFLSDVYTNELVDGSSMWFTRGWTLQELIAPQKVVFYNQSWSKLGTRKALSAKLSKWTSIHISILRGAPPSEYSIAQRMSWASKRVTTRPEDIAYCLLGIFDVSMPILYGEGEKAFLRLQEEIIKYSDDHTIFAWPIHRDNQPGLLADNPKAFEHCRHILALLLRRGRSSYSMTNRGLKIKLTAVQLAIDVYYVRLACIDEKNRDSFPSVSRKNFLGMFLRRLMEDDQYARVNYLGKTFMDSETLCSYYDDLNSMKTRQIEFCIPQRLPTTKASDFNCRERIQGFSLANLGLLAYDVLGKEPFQVHAYKWEPQNRMVFMKPGSLEEGCLLDLRQQKRKIEEIRLAFDFDCNPTCHIVTSRGLTMEQAKRIRFTGVGDWKSFDLSGNLLESKQHPGSWEFKGDRIKGLYGLIKTDKNEDVAHVCVHREQTEGKLIWTVQLCEAGEEGDMLELRQRRILERG